MAVSGATGISTIPGGFSEDVPAVKKGTLIFKIKEVGKTAVIASTSLEVNVNNSINIEYQVLTK